MENARLEVELRARLEALRASRARLVEAGDAERRRLGRDLHDGAQQRLVALMIELQLARERFDSDPAGARELVDSAFANAQEAVDELRDLAAGIHPAVLVPARPRRRARVARQPRPRAGRARRSWPSGSRAAVETAAYFVVAEALTNVAKYAGATHARVAVRRENGHAVIDVRDDGVGGADSAPAPGCAASATASARSTARSRSKPARRGHADRGALPAIERTKEREDGQDAAMVLGAGGDAELGEDLVTCFSTACGVTTSSSAMPLFERPSAISSSTSRSRGVRASSGSSRRRRPSMCATTVGSSTEPPLPTRRTASANTAEVGHAVLEQVADALGVSPIRSTA